jgi:hypothetical protein
MGSTTDLDGKYLFSGLQNGVVIIASYIGYKTTQTILQNQWKHCSKHIIIRRC